MILTWKSFISVSFLFNWIGFLFSLCIVQTVAGRCGALSGLGLGIVKWVAIIKVDILLYILNVPIEICCKNTAFYRSVCIRFPKTVGW